MPFLPRHVAGLAAFATASSVCPTLARAIEPPRTSALSWTRLPGAEGCVGTRDLARAVEQRLGRPVFVAPSQADVFIEGRVERALPGSSFGLAGFHAHLTVTDAKGAVVGTRDLDSPTSDCRSLEEQLALVMALLVDPDAELRPATTPVAPPSRATPVAQAVVAVPPTPPPREPWHVKLSLGPAIVAGLLPKAGVVLFIRGEVVPSSLIALEFGGAVGLDTHADAGAGSAGGTSLSLSYGMLGACPVAWTSGGTGVLGCADIEVGAIRSVGYGFAKNTGAAGQETPIVQATVNARMSHRIVGPVEAGVGLGLIVPFLRQQLLYLDATGMSHEVFRTASVAAQADGFVGIAFP